MATLAAALSTLPLAWEIARECVRLLNAEACRLLPRPLTLLCGGGCAQIPGFPELIAHPDHRHSGRGEQQPKSELQTAEGGIIKDVRVLPKLPQNTIFIVIIDVVDYIERTAKSFTVRVHHADQPIYVIGLTAHTLLPQNDRVHLMVEVLMPSRI